GRPAVAPWPSPAIDPAGPGRDMLPRTGRCGSRRDGALRLATRPPRGRGVGRRHVGVPARLRRPLGRGGAGGTRRRCRRHAGVALARRLAAGDRHRAIQLDPSPPAVRGRGRRGTAGPPRVVRRQGRPAPPCPGHQRRLHDRLHGGGPPGHGVLGTAVRRAPTSRSGLRTACDRAADPGRGTTPPGRRVVLSTGSRPEGPRARQTGPMNSDSVAVYLDFDNIVISRYDQVHGKGSFWRDRDHGFDDAKLAAAEIDVHAILDYASSFGRLALTRAYADWSMPVNTRYRKQLVDRAIDLIQLFPASGSKNGADIRLAVDALE